jgi:2,3-bisphosphoglycerate-independent phosphoglycerate mutase
MLLTVAGCGGTPVASGPAADSPAGVVRTALDMAAAKNLDGLRGLACAGQEDIIRQQLGIPAGIGANPLPGIGTDLLPGIDTQALLDAVALDVSKVKIGDATIGGDTATVPVSGDLGITFDAAAMRPILQKVLASQGRTMTDAQLDALLKGLATYGQAVPLDQSVRLVRESGAWKICQQTVAPVPS